MKTFGVFQVFLFALGVMGQAEKLTCNLEWTAMDMGSSLPEFSVAATNESQYVARVMVGNNYAVGRYSVKDSYIFYPDSGIERHTMYGEILTNPYSCLLNWVNTNHPDVSATPVLKVTIASNNSHYIARWVSQSGDFYPGSVHPTSKVMTVTENGTVLQVGEPGYYVLTSVSDGIHLNVNDVILENDPFEGPTEMLGVDEILNDSESEVKQTVEHLRIIDEKVKFTSEEHIFRVSSSVGMSGGIGIPGFLGFGASFSSSTSHEYKTSNSYSVKKTREIKVIREVAVPKFSSVQFCTTLKVVPNFSSPWRARAEFSCRGWSPEQMKAYLLTQPEWANKNLEIDDGLVVTTVQGTISGAVASQSKFHAYDSSQNGCQILKKYLQHQKVRIMRGDIINWDKEEFAINHVLDIGSDSDRPI